MVMKKAKKICLGILYWILSLTWGGLMTWVGLLVTGVIIIFFHGKVYLNGFSYIVEVQQCKGGWGLELGAPALASKGSVEGVRKHEFGHSIQNIIWGPLYLFVIGLPSLIRYWYRRYLHKHHKPITTDYDSIWFEGQATRWGTKIVNRIEYPDYQAMSDAYCKTDAELTMHLYESMKKEGVEFNGRDRRKK